MLCSIRSGYVPGQFGCRARREFEMLLTAYEQQEPRAKVGKQHAYILYGPSGAFFLDGDELKMDIRGLVYKPVSRMQKEKHR